MEDKGSDNDAKPTEQVQAKKPAQKAKKSERPIIKYDDIHSHDDKDKPEGGMGDVYQLLAMVAGGACYFYKSKMVAWLCLYFFFSSIINMPFSAMMQQGTASFGLVTIAFMQCYVAPDPAELERRKKAAELMKNPEKQILEK